MCSFFFKRVNFIYEHWQKKKPDDKQFDSTYIKNLALRFKSKNCEMQNWVSESETEKAKDLQLNNGKCGEKQFVGEMQW